MPERGRRMDIPVPPEVQPKLDNALAFVKRNITPARKGRKCVDGRYSSEQSKGSIATPGGDFGYVLTYMALRADLDPKECFNRVYSALSEMGEGFFMHTDNLGHGVTGCGHIGKALSAEYAASYDLDARRVEEAFNYAMGERNSGTKNITLITLNGEHKELGVLRIKDSRNTVKPSDDQSMYFVYDEARDKALMKKLVARIGDERITPDQFIKEHTVQLGAILHILAGGKGAPIFDVYANDKVNPQVKFAEIIN